MNLGDGLLFELENGKPRLILLNHGAEKKPAKLSTTTWKTPVGQRSRQASRLDGELQREEVTGQRREARRKTGLAAAGTSSTSSTHDAPGRSGTKPLASRNTSKANHPAVGVAKIAPGLSHNRSKNMPSRFTNCKTGLPTNEEDTAGPNHNRLSSLANGVAGLKEGGVVYLTSQQLQQILSSIQNSASTNQNSEEEQHWQGKRCDSTVKEAAGEGEVEGERSPGCRTGISEEKENNVLTWLGDRETESRVSQNDKKTRWRRELDEQVAVKQKRVSAERQDGDGALSVQSSARELPAVFKSNFRLKEGCAEECVKGEGKREEERRRWLEQLDRQKEENTLRRRQEKELLKQTEDYEHWAMHFDSLHRRIPVPLPTCASTLPPTTLSSSALPTAPGGGAERVESAVGGRVPSTSLSLLWDNLSSCGAESVGRASVDAAAGYNNRASHLRTMTALLDPAEIEERERRRIKQLELQRAIEAQVEERRQRREREEEMRREEERMEERRVEEERRELQRQYELNTLRERQKEEKQFVRQQLLYESVQSAQQEALHLKQKQRILELNRKGHDVGRLLESIGHNVGNGLEEVAGAKRTDEGEKTIVSRLKDISVQTECPQTPPRPLISPPPPPAARNDKENPRLPAGERGEREGGEKRGEGRVGERTAGDLYERFARTDKCSKRVNRRPDWNVNRPSGSFVPASERYPASLQRSRQEARLRRQTDLLALQERSCLSRTDNPNPGPPPSSNPGPPSSNPGPPSFNPGPPSFNPGPPNSNLGHGQSNTSPSAKEVDSKTREAPVCPSIHSERKPLCRGHSPPVPAIRHGQKKRPLSSSQPRPLSDSSCPHPALSTTPPSQLEFVPYIRTDEVYQLHATHTDPLQMTSPTYLPPAPHPRTPRGRAPLLHNTYTHAQTHNTYTHAQTHRQQEILRGLAQLRQGLLQKQQELESSLNPQLNHHDNHLSSSP